MLHKRELVVLSVLAGTVVIALILLVIFIGVDSVAEFLMLLRFILMEQIGKFLLMAAISFYVLRVVWQVHSKALAITFGTIVLGGVLYLWGSETNAPHLAMPAFMESYHPGHVRPDLPFVNIVKFFAAYKNFEKIADIGANPNVVPPPLSRNWSETVKIYLETKEVISEVAAGVYFNYWTFNAQVPGPMLRVRVGDTVEMTIKNDPSSLHSHNIDLHAVTGPGGGALLSMVAPGETKSFSWKALQPGLYVYHCAMPNVSTHNSHGQYGLILVESEEGMAPVDKEFYIMLGELYTQGSTGKQGLAIFDSEALLDGIPTYITMNGRVEESGKPRMTAKVGDKIRIYVGNGGLNLISSFHAIGEIFDTVYPEGGIGAPPLKNIQTTAVLPGGSSIVEFTAEVPGDIVLVDHALSRMNKGAWAVIHVVGDPQPDIFGPLDPTPAVPDTPRTMGM